MWWVASAAVLTTLLSIFFVFKILHYAQTRTYMSLFKTRVVVTLKSGEAFEGIMMSQDRRCMRLVDALQFDGADRIPVAGDLFLLLTEVHYMQRPGGES